MSGIIGVWSTKKEDITDSLTYGLISQQSRGENGCGIGVAKHGIKIKRRYSLAGPFFVEKKSEHEKTFYEFLKSIKPFAGIGHTLYEKNSKLQPTELENDKYHAALVMDGTLLGINKPNDVFILENFFQSLDNTNDELEASQLLMEKLNDGGFYNALILLQNKGNIKLIAIRDPRGGKPLSLGKVDNTYVIASETQGLDGAKAHFIEDISPGNAYVFDENGYKKHSLIKKPHAHCIFEHIYFASPNSIIEGKNVLEVRVELGRRLYRRHGYKPDVICPSPDSGRGCGIGYSKEAGIDLQDWITKNPGAPRTFQIEEEILRILASLSKFNINPMVRGKCIGVSEDSIVRATVTKIGTSDKMKHQLAKEVAILVSYAPMPFPCYRSLNPKDKMAAESLENLSVEEAGIKVAKRIGIDKVFYNSIEDVLEACGNTDFCTACATGDYHFIKPSFLKH